MGAVGVEMGNLGELVCGVLTRNLSRRLEGGGECSSYGVLCYDMTREKCLSDSTRMKLRPRICLDQELGVGEQTIFQTGCES